MHALSMHGPSKKKMGEERGGEEKIKGITRKMMFRQKEMKRLQPETQKKTHHWGGGKETNNDGDAKYRNKRKRRRRRENAPFFSLSLRVHERIYVRMYVSQALNSVHLEQSCSLRENELS